MPLFHYQKIIHKRKLSPGPFKVYRTYKKYLKIEFNATCVYCRMPDFLSEEKSYAVEHYKPKIKFPDLETEYSNLFYSCCNCNGYKGVFWPDTKQRILKIFIPNPCDHVMHNHLRSQTTGTIKPHSFAGSWTIDLLDLNAPGQIQKRQFFLTLKKNTDSLIEGLQKQRAELSGIEKTINRTKLKPVQQDIAKVENQLEELGVIIKNFGA